ncbi:hypothetical protein [Desulfobulbus oralis]|uniref:Uncharacterized protein n=1 Tax=Desulfobulbus oralis TaxID=1986146 RepID=A0A2L1GNY1_9BACT|nr:hypothetical protein [Desulfobulbus oralis]AVD71379.1 hypothetical protein CAY53_07795 [Desulfobulbus oralis]
MSIVKIVVADVVYTGAPLGKATSPEELERQAEALAGLKGSIISAWVSAQYPDAELYADVAIYTGSGPERPRPLEVFAYDENGALNEAASQTLQTALTEALSKALA